MPSTGDGVLLLHGIGRGASSMRRVDRALAGAGYRTCNLDYPGRRMGLAALADYVDAQAAPWAAALDGDLHIVTQSMGGLVARVFIARHRPARLGRVVMLAPPNGGSELADLLGRTSPYNLYYGPAGAELGTRRSPEAEALFGAVDWPLGIIAGTRSLGLLSWAILPKPNDGRVSVASTRLPGMADHLVLPANHTFITHNAAAIRATLDFLRDGRFRR